MTGLIISPSGCVTRWCPSKVERLELLEVQPTPTSPVGNELLQDLYLTFRNVVPAEGADDEASVAGVGLGAVARISGAGLGAAAAASISVSGLSAAGRLRRR